MAKIDIVNLAGQKVGDLEVLDEVFSVEVRQHLLWEMVKQQLASRRSGNHSTLRRDEVRGGGKKPYRQKGTGRARQGSSRAPNFVGGGKVFTPKPRSYEYQMPRKARQAALRCALSLRASESKLIIIDSLDLPEIKTRRFAEALTNLKLSSALIVGKADNINLIKSVSNLQVANFRAEEGINVYDILKHEGLLLTSDTVKALEARLSPIKTASPRSAS